MEVKGKNVSKKSEKSVISIMLYVVASVVAIVGVALLVNNVFLYKTNFNQAVAQGYSAATVRNALITSQLLPGIFEPIGIYGGIAFLLLGVGMINKKVSKCLILLTKAEVCNDVIEENAETIEQTETVEEEIKA